MLRRTSILALLLTLTFTLVGWTPAQAAPPVVTDIKVSKATIYPSINNAKRPGTTTITVESTDLATIDHVEVRSPGDTVLRDLPLNGATSVVWDGRNNEGILVDHATYTIHAASSTNEHAVEPFATVAVSRQHLVKKTYIRVTKANLRTFTYVGKCSTLRKPSKRGWKGSLGYYANTKCKKQTWKSSAVITGHSLTLPAVERFIDARVDTYGGAAKARKSSRGSIEYWNGTEWSAFKWAGKKVGWHYGLTRSAGTVISADRKLVWRFAAAFKDKYDVAKFRTVVRYEALSAPPRT